MAQADNTKANKLAYLHVRIVQRVLRKLLQYIVTQNNEQWTLADYIHANGEQILRTQFGPRHFQILFPRNSEVTIDALPLYLIEHLITDVPGCFVVHRDINHAIHALNQSRRESNTAVVTGVGDVFFDDQFEEVQQLLTTVCRLINNNSLQSEVQMDIESLRRTSFGNDEIVLDEFNEHYEKEKSSRKAITSITNEQRTFHQRLAQVAVLHKGNEPAQSTEQRTEPLCSVDMYPVQVTDAVLELVVQTNNTTGNARISRDFVNMVNNQEDSSEPSALRERRHEIRAHVANTFSYYGDFYAKQGCVQICVKPRSVKLLFELFEDCVSGEITKKLKPVEKLIRGITNFEAYKQEVVLYQDHYDSVMNDIASQIRQQFKDRGFTFENESTIPRNLECRIWRKVCFVKG
ncbi:hypothetical protein DPMN_022422 [Dreissena polymorpha]|uniref:Uncharacterized protein n=1 Tax=Dreissena polymorpha TaxID=45954 RepID=A0A9D4SAS8_DREPO|nr:hypothetical protein DPMN_022422 [Dreissena polymorpha]